jgi:kynureninase
MQFETTEAFALDLDQADPLASLRKEFHIPRDARGGDLIYFVGHSLGLQPMSTRAAVGRELDRWADLGVEGHFRGESPWTLYQEILAPKMAALVGAGAEETTLMNALTVNLHQMMVSFYRPTRDRYRILMEEHAFPSDRYAVAAQCAFHGYDPDDAIITVRSRPGEHTLRTEDIEEVLTSHGSEIALVLFGGINYYTGQYFDLKRISRAGRQAGCCVGFDLAHAVGNVELALHDWGADFAVWCCYKYLNGGPGSLAGCFVHDRHFGDRTLPRFSGWWGEPMEKRFRMEGAFEPMRGAAGWQASNPNVLSLASIKASLSLFDDAGLDRLRAKRDRLTGYLEYLIDSRLPDTVEVLTPRDPAQRGSQLSLSVRPNGRATYERLRASGVVCDWRNPDVIRAAPVPLYNTFHEVWRFVDLMTAD